MKILSAVPAVFPAAALIAAMSFNANAEPFPNRPVTIVTGAPGNVLDTLSRDIADRLSKKWGQPVIVENKTGAGGLIASDVVARAKPDGYTISHGIVGSIVAAHTMKNPLVQPATDMQPLIQTGITGLLLAANPSVAENTPAELAAQERAHPGKFSYGSYGAGTVAHLYGHIYNKQESVNMVHVAYKGEANSLNDVLGGQLPLVFLTPAGAAPHVQAGKIKAIAVTGAERSPILPNTPTFREFGYQGMDAYGWFGMYTPKNTPADINKKLADDIEQILQSPDLIEKYRPMGLELQSKKLAEFESIVARDSAMWKAAILEAGIPTN